MSEPPSSLGGFHDNVTLSLRMSVTSIGPSGASGTSENRKNIHTVKKKEEDVNGA